MLSTWGARLTDSWEVRGQREECGNMEEGWMQATSQQRVVEGAWGDLKSAVLGKKNRTLAELEVVAKDVLYVYRRGGKEGERSG